ncbi:MAG: SCE4755 family polysaccharide monooxygenase-like protein [Polyangia bacterium]
MNPRLLCSASLLVTVLAATDAQAHIALMSPKARYSDLKSGPCGRGALDVRTNNVTTFKPGETITVTWQETVSHPGHYRIAFDPDGTHFTDPSSFTDTAPRMYVLKDNIADKTGTQMYTDTVTLPNVECTNCTLQVIQVMTDKPPYGDGNDLYYQCADLVLRADPPDMAGTSDLSVAPVADMSVTEPAPTPGGMATGCTMGALGSLGSGGGLAGVGVLGLALAGLRGRRRHRRS